MNKQAVNKQAVNKQAVNKQAVNKQAVNKQAVNKQVRSELLPNATYESGPLTTRDTDADTAYIAPLVANN